MGYEIARVVSDIDDEFLCSICTMVLENPMQSPCEHIFCNDCIKEWLKVEANCPVDRFILAVDDLKPAPRYFRNMLDKIEMKCKFEPQGCQTIIPLEHLQIHLTKCAFNPSSEIVCDKGCNIKMNRRDYEVSNCFTHLANRVDRQFIHFENVISRQGELITKLNNKASRQQEEITKLNEEICRVRNEATQSENNVRHLREKLSKLKNKSSTLNTPQKCSWRMCRNFKTSIDLQNILEYSATYGNAFAQLFHPLGPENSCFKVRILSMIDCSSICIGLTRKYHPDDIPPGLSNGSIGYRSNGELYVDKRCESTKQKWIIGDVIECGIKFRDDRTNSVDVYLSINEQLLSKNAITMPSDLVRNELFPSIFMWGPPVSMAGSRYGTIGKVQYLGN